MPFRSVATSARAEIRQTTPLATTDVRGECPHAPRTSVLGEVDRVADTGPSVRDAVGFTLNKEE